MLVSSAASARRGFDFGRSGRHAGRPRFAHALIAPFGQKLESQRAGDRRGLDQLHA